MSEQELVTQAIADGDTALLAAAARAGASLPSAAARALSTLTVDGIRVEVAAADQVTLAEVDDAYVADPAGEAPPRVLRTTTPLQVLLALLAASRPTRRAPLYPGREVEMHEVIARCRPESVGRTRHLQHGLRRLERLGLCVFSTDERDRTLVRPGPAVLLLTGPWFADDLHDLLDELEVP